MAAVSEMTSAESSVAAALAFEVLPLRPETYASPLPQRRGH